MPIEKLESNAPIRLKPSTREALEILAESQDERWTTHARRVLERYVYKHREVVRQRKEESQ